MVGTGGNDPGTGGAVVGAGGTVVGVGGAVVGTGGAVVGVGGTVVGVGGTVVGTGGHDPGTGGADGLFWARMAYLDIGHPQAQDVFFDSRNRLNFNNLTSVGSDTYEPLADRQPRYGGANIIPLSVTGNGDVSVQVTNLGNGLPESNFTATLSILSSDGSVRYVDLPNGSGQATVGANEEASLVVVNTPDTLYMYDPQSVGADASSDPENTGLSYRVLMTGAVPAN